MSKISSTKRTPLREKFWFFENYWKSVRNLPDNIQLEVLTAIIERSFYGVEPNMSNEAEDTFSIMRHGIDESLKNYQNGCQPKKKKGNTDIQQNAEFDSNFADSENISEKRTETRSESSSETHTKESKTDTTRPQSVNSYGSSDSSEKERFPF